MLRVGIVFDENFRRDGSAVNPGKRHPGDRSRRIFIGHEASITYEKMHTTLLSPLEHEDIDNLVNQMDSIFDMTEAAVARIFLYRVNEPLIAIIEQASILGGDHLRMAPDDPPFPPHRGGTLQGPADHRLS